MRSGANLYMRKGFLIYEEMRESFPIHEEAVSDTHKTLHPIPLNSLYMRKMLFSFLLV